MSTELRNIPPSRGHIFGICSSFGFDPNKLTEIRITPNYVEVTYLQDKTIITASVPVKR